MLSGGVPGQLLWPFEPVYFIQTPNIVYMIWQRDHLVRRIRLTDKHSEHVTPSWFGVLIGHYENGDTLVVDTVGFTKISYIDNFRTPHSEKLHVVERFTIAPGGKGMSGAGDGGGPRSVQRAAHHDEALVQLPTARWWKPSALRTISISQARTCFLSPKQKRPTSDPQHSGPNCRKTQAWCDSPPFVIAAAWPTVRRSSDKQVKGH